MSKERVVELGGEILRVGDMVMVYNGRSSREFPVTKVGTKRIFLRVNGREVPFGMESRRDCVGKSAYFRTKTEIAEDLEHRTVEETQEQKT